MTSSEFLKVTGIGIKPISRILKCQLESFYPHSPEERAGYYYEWRKRQDEEDKKKREELEWRSYETSQGIGEIIDFKI